MAPRKSPKTMSQTEGHKCSVCGLVVARNSDMSRHMKTHAENRSQILHRCTWPDCTFANLQKSNVDTHYRTHTGDKNRKCPDCDFRTVDPGSLTRHRKRLHQYVPAPRKARGTGGQSANAITTTPATRRCAPYSRRSASSSSSSSSSTPLSRPTIFLESKYTALALTQGAVKVEDREVQEVGNAESRYFWRFKDVERIIRSPSPKTLLPAVDTGRHMQETTDIEDNVSNDMKLELPQERTLAFEQPVAVGNWDFAMPPLDFEGCVAALGENWMCGMMINEGDFAQHQSPEWVVPETSNFGLDFEIPCVQQLPESDATGYSYDWMSSVLPQHSPSSLLSELLQDADSSPSPSCLSELHSTCSSLTPVLVDT